MILEKNTVIYVYRYIGLFSLQPKICFEKASSSANPVHSYKIFRRYFSFKRTNTLLHTFSNTSTAMVKRVAFEDQWPALILFRFSAVSDYFPGALSPMIPLPP